MITRLWYSHICATNKPDDHELHTVANNHQITARVYQCLVFLQLCEYATYLSMQNSKWEHRFGRQLTWSKSYIVYCFKTGYCCGRRIRQKLLPVSLKWQSASDRPCCCSAVWRCSSSSQSCPLAWFQARSPSWYAAHLAHRLQQSQTHYESPYMMSYYSRLTMRLWMSRDHYNTYRIATLPWEGAK